MLLHDSRIFDGEAAIIHSIGDVETILYLYCRHLATTAADSKPGELLARTVTVAGT